MWELILGIAFKLLGLAIDKSASTKEMKEAFLKFAEAYGSKQNNSVKLHDSYEEQKKELLKPPGETL